jgi:8-oxo-dGTP diphosphatase
MKRGIDFTGITTAFCCHDGNGNILLAKRSKNCRDEQGRWDIGAGSLEFGLSPEENLMKEVKEEYCVDVLEYTFLGFRSVKRKLSDGTPTHWISFDYLVRIDRKKVKNGEPESIDEIQWFTLDNLPEPLHSQLPSFLERHRKILSKTLSTK